MDERADGPAGGPADGSAGGDLGSPGPVERDERGSRLVVQADGHEAELVYEVDGGRLLLLHTGVPRPIGARGIGRRLVVAAVDLAAEQGLAVVPLCSFARVVLERDPGLERRAVVDWTAAGGPPRRGPAGRGPARG